MDTRADRRADLQAIPSPLRRARRGQVPQTLGPEFQRPGERAAEQGPEAVRLWHEETWPAIGARAKAEDGEVLFADQVGIRSDQVTGRPWDAKGDAGRPPDREPVFRERNARDQRLRPDALHGLHRVIRREGHGRFLARLAGHFDHKVHLIVDRHSAHASKTVRTWLTDHKDEIELHFLPSYSPELNPDELVNADLKRSLPHTHRARNRAALAAETRRFFHRRQPQPQPHIVTGYFKAPHVG
ncbi:transposase [Streptomyces anulatus]